MGTRLATKMAFHCLGLAGVVGELVANLLEKGGKGPEKSNLGDHLLGHGHQEGPDLCRTPLFADYCRGSRRALPLYGHEAVPLPRELVEDLLVGQAPARYGPEAVPDPVVEVRVGGSPTRCGFEAVRHPKGLEEKLLGGWFLACPVPSPTASGRALTLYGFEAVAGPGVLLQDGHVPRSLSLDGVESVPGQVSSRALTLCGPFVETGPG